MPDPGPSLDLGFARLDLQRAQRCGFPEVIFGEGKPVDLLLQIVHAMRQAQQDCLVTRVNDDQADALQSAFPQGEQDRVAKTFWLAHQTREPRGLIAVVTAGTADLPVAREATATIRAFGIVPDLIADVGVAGLHRLLAELERIRKADVVIVVAGMEGALPSVVGGLVAVPVIAVPTSVGYGAQLHGISALLSMINSCAANVAVVNIDAGFKAGYIASMMANSMHQRK